MKQPSWILSHIQRWEEKPQLRYFYEVEIFERILTLVNQTDVVVEIGSGPGFLKPFIPNLISTDVEKGARVSCVADASNLPFKKNSGDAYICVDVLHHFYQPGKFFDSVSYSLKTGGKIIFVEPWAGAMGYIFYRFFHHEDCKRVKQPFGPTFTFGKSPMDGNAMIVRQCLFESESELIKHGLKIRNMQFFGSLSYLLTGGFKKWGAPIYFVKALLAVERILPKFILRIIALRISIVLEKT